MLLNSGWRYQDQVNSAWHERRLLDFYVERYPHSSAPEWRARIEAEQVLVNGEPAPAEQILRRGQTLSYWRAPWREPPAPLEFDVLYEDEDLWIIDKPAGLPVLPGGNFLENTLLHQLRRRFPQDDPVPVHRLGRGTSGLMLAARSDLARRELTEQFRRRRLRKVYWALVETWDLPDRVETNQPIGPIPHPQLGQVWGADPGGKPAQSSIQVLERLPDRVLLEVAITTGRPHQIRIHLAALGHPLQGDPLYELGGLPRADAVPGQIGYCLQSHHLGFDHPRTGNYQSFSASAPSWWKAEITSSPKTPTLNRNQTSG